MTINGESAGGSHLLDTLLLVHTKVRRDRIDKTCLHLALARGFTTWESDESIEASAC